MFKSLIVAAALVISTTAQATNSAAKFLFAGQIQQIQETVVSQGLNWKVGDENNYKLSIGGFLNGTMKMYVRDIGPDDLWMVQDIDLSIQKQKVEALLDINTGELKKLLVNGEEQELPKADFEIVEQKEATVTVKAGTFKTIYLKIKDNSQKGAISEQWVNPRDIPLSGMAKSVADSQIGKVNIELTSFKRN